MNRRHAILPLLLALSVPVTVRAQQSQAEMCWAAHPQPRCSSFLVTNAGLYTRLVDFAGDEAPVSAVFDGGFMVNVSRRDAVGASYMGSLDNNHVAGPAIRYRRWLQKDASIDLALGVATSGASGALGLVKISPANWVGLALRPNVLRFPYSTQRRFVATAGLEFSGPPAVAMTALGFLAVILAIASCGCTGD
jgi:hypothetical protein